MIYEDGVLDKILLDNGYIQDGKHYIYVRDHLGNNRLVVDAEASKVVQSTHYYPFGTSFAESTGQEEQPYKYNNKELDDRAGLNWYDYSTRMKDDWSFTTIDPLAEKYYSISPYAYVANNPMKFIDPTGMWIDDYFSTGGSYLGTDNSSSTNVRIMDKGQWELLKNDDGTIDPSVGALASTLPSEAEHLSLDAIKNIFSHYNPTSLNIIEESKPRRLLAYSYRGNLSTGELEEEKFKINSGNILANKLADNISDIKNTFAHEIKHYKDMHKMGLVKFHYLPIELSEINAIKYQIEDSSWNNTSPYFQQTVISYGKENGWLYPNLYLNFNKVLTPRIPTTKITITKP